MIWYPVGPNSGHVYWTVEILNHQHDKVASDLYVIVVTDCVVNFQDRCHHNFENFCMTKVCMAVYTQTCICLCVYYVTKSSISGEHNNYYYSEGLINIA